MIEEQSSYLEGPAFGFVRNTPDDGTDELTGERVGEFLVGDKIGAGGMGVVYEAQQEHPHRAVALKLIRPGVFSRKAHQRFEVEREVLGRLQHPGIAQIYQAGTAETQTGKRPFFAMELISGRPLFEYAETEDLSVRKRLELFCRIGDSVQYAHTKGVIHRDLKPDNILVDRSGQPKILDFGVARAIDLDVQLTTHNTDIRQLVGTLAYMSPEQVTGNPNDIDARSDVYSLGIIGYGLLAGRFPYEVSDKAIPEAARIICEQEPTPLSSNHKHLRGDVDAIISKALEKDPQRRYQSALELTADVRRFLDHQPIIARPPSAVYQICKYAQRHKGLCGAGAAALMLLILGIIGTSIGLWKAKQSELEAMLAQQVAQNNLVLAEKREQETNDAHDQLMTVVKFQSSMLSHIDAETMGRNIFTNIRERTLEGLVANGAFQEQIDAVQVVFDELNATDIALKIVDEEILGRAVETIEVEFADQPLVEAKLRLTIGNTYYDLGLFPQALPQLKRALAIYRRELGDDHAATLESMVNISVLLRGMGKLEEALTYVRAALKTDRRVLNDDHPDTARSMNSMAGVLIAQGKYAEAEQLLRKTLDIHRHIFGEEHKYTLYVTGNLATAKMQQGRCAEAEKLFRKVLDVQRRVVGEEHPKTLSWMHNLAASIACQGKFAEAEQLYRETLDIERHVLGDEHPNTLNTRDCRASMLCVQGSYAEAATIYRDVLEIKRHVLGEEHSSVLHSMSNLALALQGQGRYVESMKLIRKTVDAQRRVLGEEHASTLWSMSVLGSLFINQGSYAEAEKLHRRLVEIRRRVLGEKHRETLTSMSYLAESMEHGGKLEEAEELYRRTIKAMRNTFGAEHAVLASTLLGLGEILLKRTQPQEAHVWIDEALSILSAALPDDHLDLALAQSAMGECLTALGQFAEAETLAVSSYERLKVVKGRSGTETIQARTRIVELYEAWGKPEKAREYRAMLSTVGDSINGTADAPRGRSR